MIFLLLVIFYIIKKYYFKILLFIAVMILLIDLFIKIYLFANKFSSKNYINNFDYTRYAIMNF